MRPRVWTVFLAFVIVVPLALLTSGVAMGLAIMLDMARSNTCSPDQATYAQEMKNVTAHPWALLVGLIPTSVILFLGALAAARLSKQPLVDRLKLGGGIAPPDVLLASFLGTLGAGASIHSLLALIGWRSEVAQMFGGLARGESSVFLVLLVAGSMGPGFGEELFFRGYLQTRLVERWGPWVGIAITSIAFGLMHVEPTHMVTATAIGLWLGWVAVRTGGIRAGIVAHAANNASAFLLARVGLSSVAPAGHWAYVIGGCAAVAFAAGFVKRRALEPEPISS